MGVLALFLFAAPAPAPALASDPIRMVFLAPSANEKHPFWGNYIRFMQAAAEDLGVDLTVVSSKDRYDQVDAARDILEGENKPDYLITVFLKGTGVRILDLADANGVPVFLVNTRIQIEDMNLIGYPRKQYPGWLGDMCYNDRQGGLLLGRTLLDAARRGGKAKAFLELLGFTGSRDNSASKERVQGLYKALENREDVVLARVLNCFWDAGVAREKTSRMLAMHPGISIIWAASNSMALGAVQAVEEAGRTPGRDVFLGGFDWTSQALDAIEKGRLVASVGGHFMEGAWAVVLLHDHHKGLDFASLGLEYVLPMHLLDGSSVAFGRQLLDPNRWGKTDFRSFSRVYNGRAEYDFSLAAVLTAMGLPTR